MGAWVHDGNVALLTDLYELTMAASYVTHGMEEPATFDLFVRKLPRSRAFLVACGLEQALDYLEALRFEDDAIGYLASLGRFDDDFLERLRGLRFTGEVWAVPEGEAVFAEEPILSVTAPLPEAQIVETFLVNTIAFQTMIASKAARVALACGGRRFDDFSARRDHGADAAVKVARASYVGGADGTSNVLAGRTYGIPVSGTMAHSYVMRFDREIDAFRTFARDFPDHAVLLIDTYDTEEGARRAAEVARELAPEGVTVRAVRIDSGDLLALSRSVRSILDENDQSQVRIFASGDLDEHRIADLLAAGAPIDAFGVGTQLGTSGDASALGAVYKLVEDAGGPKAKLSRGKATLPGRKQVWRASDSEGRYQYDLIAVEDEDVTGCRPLLRRAMADGSRTAAREALEDIRDRCCTTLDLLPARLRSLEPVEPGYEVRHSAGLETLMASLPAH